MILAIAIIFAWIVSSGWACLHVYQNGRRTGWRAGWKARGEVPERIIYEFPEDLKP